MNGFDKLLQDATSDDLGPIKLNLFREHVRLEMEKTEIEEKVRLFKEEKEQFFSEMKVLNKKIESDKKRLREDQIFFEKKLSILQNGFQQLDADRRKVEQERQALHTEREHMQRRGNEFRVHAINAKSYFQGVNNTLTLKKRYKDLIKIFHPDNLCGDTDTVKVINQEYAALRDKFGMYE